MEANSERTLKITVSDLTITGLYYADGVKLNGIVSAYRDARRKEPKIAATDHAKGPTRRASRLRLFTEGTPVGPGTSDYFAHALSALLTRSPNINLQLILGLLGDEDTRLRKIAYSAAGMVTLDRAKVISRLKSIVRGVPADSDRFDAAEALASQGTQGRAELMNLARFSSRPSRAAAVASLVSNGDCTSPFLLLAVADSDFHVRRAGLTALLSKNWNTSFKCLAPLVADRKLEPDLRKRILYSLSPNQTREGKVSTKEQDINDIFEALRPILSDRHSTLYESAWEVLKDILLGHKANNTAILEIADKRLREGLTNKDKNLVCTLVFLEPTILSRETALLERMISYIGHEKFRDCVTSALLNVNFDKPNTARLRPTIVAQLLPLTYLSKNELRLVNKSIPESLFAQQWRHLAASKTGTSRLGIYRIAAERELAVDKAAALFINVLSGKTDGLGVKKKDQYSDNYEIRYQYMPAAVEALLSMSERGEAILGEFLRGERGPALARITIGFVIIQVGSEISAEARQKFAPGFRQDLAAAAIRDKDPEVRAYALSALRLVMNREELIRTVRPLFRDPNKDVIYEICDLIVQKNSSDFSMGLSKEDGETIMGTLLANSDPYVRGKAAAVLVKVANRVSPEFINRTLERLLLDEEQQPREEALRVLGDLKPASASSLARVPKTGQADRVLIGGLAAGIVSLGPDGKALLPDLLTLQNRFPHAVPLIEALGAVANEDPTITSILIEQLRSDDEGVRNAALNALSARHFFVSGSETYLAALIEEKTPTHLETYLGNILEKIRPYSGPVPLSGRVENFPQFPWPPPPWSFKEIVPKNLLGAQNVDLS